MAPKVTIIIVNWNGEEVFPDCLKSLQELTYPNWELVVVDNGSLDGSENLVSNHNLKFKEYILIKNSKNLGFAPANNQGVKKSTGEYILLLNNDTKVTPDFLSIMVEKMERDRQIGAMQPKIYLLDLPGFLDNTGAYLTRSGFLQHWGFKKKDGGGFDKERLIFSAKGACLLTRKSLVDKIGLFDNDFGSYFEETDFCFRVWLAGFKVLYYPKANIFHKLGATSIKMNQYFVNYHSFKNRILSLFKNLDGPHLITILLPHLLIVTGLGFYYLIKLEFRKSWMIFKAILWNLINILNSFSKRMEVQRLRKVADDDIFPFIMEDVKLTQMFAHFKKVEANF